MPTAKPLIMRTTINMATSWTAHIKVDPTIQMTQATKSESLRPNRSLTKVEKMEPNREPPAMLAVIPPCRTEFGLWK